MQIGEVLTMAYIEREAAIKALMNDAPEQVGYSREDASDCIRYMDAVDVASVRHGWWGSYEPYLDGYRCSCCKLVHRTCTTYCPNCGAKMDGGDDNDGDNFCSYGRLKEHK